MNNCGESIWAVPLVAAAVAVASFAAIAALYRLFRRPGVRIACFLALFCSGVTLYYASDFAPPERGARVAEANPAERFIHAANNTLSIFFPSRGGYEDIKKMVRPGGQPEHARRIAFLLLHYLAYCYFAAIVFSFFGARTADRLWAWWFFAAMPRLSRTGALRWLRWDTRLKHVYVFWGVSEESETLAESLSKDKSLLGRCLFVLSRELWHEKERYSAIADRLAAKGHRVVWEDLEADGNWYELAPRHFFLGPDVKENARLAAMLVGAAVRRGILTLDVYVRGRTPKEIDGINIHHVDSADNAARQLLDAHPVAQQGEAASSRLQQGEAASSRLQQGEAASSRLNGKRQDAASPCSASAAQGANPFAVKGRCRMLLVGFGEVGQAVLKQHLMRGAYPGLELVTDVVGSDKEELESFRLLHPGLFAGDAAGEISLHPIAPSSAEFLEWVAKRGGEFDRIVVCPDAGIDCIVLGERIARVVGGPGGDCRAEIFAFDAFNESTKRRAKVKTFGKTRDLFTREMIVDALRLQHLPAAMMDAMEEQDTAAWRKTFCHNATDRMLDLMRLAGFKTVKRATRRSGFQPLEANQKRLEAASPCSLQPLETGAPANDASELAAAVEANRDAVAAAFGAARRAFMAWKGLPADKYAQTDEQFARDFFKIFDLAETQVAKQD